MTRLTSLSTPATALALPTPSLYQFLPIHPTVRSTGVWVRQTLPPYLPLVLFHHPFHYHTLIILLHLSTILYPLHPSTAVCPLPLPTPGISLPSTLNHSALAPPSTAHYSPLLPLPPPCITIPSPSPSLPLTTPSLLPPSPSKVVEVASSSPFLPVCLQRES